MSKNKKKNSEARSRTNSSSPERIKSKVFKPSNESVEDQRSASSTHYSASTHSLDHETMVTDHHPAHEIVTPSSQDLSQRFRVIKYERGDKAPYIVHIQRAYEEGNRPKPLQLYKFAACWNVLELNTTVSRACLFGCGGDLQFDGCRQQCHR